MEFKKPIKRKEAREVARNEILSELQKSHNECLEKITRLLIEQEKLRFQCQLYSYACTEDDRRNLGHLEGEIVRCKNILTNLESDINTLTD